MCEHFCNSLYLPASIPEKNLFLILGLALMTARASGTDHHLKIIFFDYCCHESIRKTCLLFSDTERIFSCRVKCFQKTSWSCYWKLCRWEGWWWRKCSQARETYQEWMKAGSTPDHTEQPQGWQWRREPNRWRRWRRRHRAPWWPCPQTLWRPGAPGV